MASDRNIEINPDDSFELNVAGATPFSGGGGLAPGYYKASCKLAGTVNVTTSRGPAKKMVFVFDVNGNERSAEDTWLPSADATPEQAETNAKVWRTVLESFGFTPDQISKGEIKAAGRSFMGGTAHVEIYKEEAKNGSGKQYDKIRFWTPSDWETRRAKGTPSNAGRGNGDPLPAASPVSPADLLKLANR